MTWLAASTAVSTSIALIPVVLGVTAMLLIALAVNNIPKSRRYPEFWL